MGLVADRHDQPRPAAALRQARAGMQAAIYMQVASDGLLSTGMMLAWRLNAGFGTSGYSCKDYRILRSHFGAGSGYM